MLIAVKPSYSNLEYRQIFLSDAQTMSYNTKWGGTIDSPRERWDVWYKKWVEEESDVRLYRLLFDGDTDRFIGEIAFYLEDEKIMLHLLIYAPFRRCGYGKEGLEILCKLARKSGHSIVYDKIAKDNLGAQALFTLKGFSREKVDEEGILFSKRLRN